MLTIKQKNLRSCQDDDPIIHYKNPHGADVFGLKRHGRADPHTTQAMRAVMKKKLLLYTGKTVTVTAYGRTQEANIVRIKKA